MFGPNGGISSGSDNEVRFVMIVLGVVLLVLGFLFSVPILWTLGIVLLIVGAVLMLLGQIGRPVGGRAHYY